MEEQREPSEFARAAYAEAIASQFASQFGGMSFPENAAFADMASGIGGALPSNFQAMFQDTAEAAAAAEEEWSEEKAAPGISKAALRRLPIVRVTEEDLCVDGNDTCVVCLDEQRVGDKAMRLPCGHLYHRDCAVDWLLKHCTCPNCRYELESDSASFERGRLERMSKRKPRYRLRDLKENLSLEELRNIAGDSSDSRERLIGIIQEKKLADIVKEPEPLCLDCDEEGLRTYWPTKHLKQLMVRCGVDSSACLEKSDLADHLVNSGRIRFLPAGEGALRENRARAALDAFLEKEALLRPPADETISAERVDSMSVKELKAELTQRGCQDELRTSLEKSDLRNALKRVLGLNNHASSTSSSSNTNL